MALIFDQVISAESLPTIKFISGAQILRTSSVTGDISRSINLSEYVLCEPLFLLISSAFNFPYMMLQDKLNVTVDDFWLFFFL